MGLEEADTNYLDLSNGEHLAYQVFGAGQVDIVFVPSWFSHIELVWEEPTMAGFLRRLGTIGRIALYDALGTGLSDPVSVDRHITLDSRAEHLTRVAEAARFDRFAIFASTMSGPLAVRVATRWPQLVSSLVLFNTAACHIRKDGYEIAWPSAAVERWCQLRTENWGRAVAPTATIATDQERLHRWIPRYQRFAVPPGRADVHFRDELAWDVTDELAAVQADTLVIHRAGNPVISPAHGRYLAAAIPGARYVELPGDDSLWNIDPSEPVLDEVEVFLTGRPVQSGDRLLATILFTDMVGSTPRAAAAGNQRWADLIEAHDRASREIIERHGGRPLQSTGDGIVSTFGMASDAVDCAHRLLGLGRDFGLELRAGLHTGECTLRGETLAGIAVHVAARILALAAPSQILVSQTVRDVLLGSSGEFTPWGVHELRGVRGDWQLFEAQRV